MSRNYRNRRRKYVDERPEYLKALAREVEYREAIVNDGGDMGADKAYRAAKDTYDKAYAQWQSDLAARAMSLELCGDF